MSRYKMKDNSHFFDALEDEGEGNLTLTLTPPL